jgi:hypothetical protein
MNRTAGDRLSALIAAVRRRWFATVALRAIGLGAGVAALPGMAAGLAYWLFAPADGALLLLAGSAVVLAAVGVVLVIKRIEPRPDDRRVARFIEERAERSGAAPLDDAVVSAVEARTSSPNDAEAAFAALVIAGALKRLEAITPATLIPPADLRHAGAVAAGGLVLAALTLVATGPALSHAIQTGRLRFFPHAVTVDVLPGHTRVVAGEPLQIRAKVRAGGGELERLTPQLVVSADGQSRTVEMTPGDDGFTYVFESVDRSFDYKVIAGRAASADYKVSALFPPRVTRIEIDYRYPAFSGLKPRVEEDGGDIYAPAGTRIGLRIHVDKPIASAELTLSGSKAPLARTDASTLHAELVLKKDDSYRIGLLDEDGLRSAGDSEYFIRLMDDRPPDVRIVRPSADQGITPLEEVSIEARAEDDYGIAALDLVYSVGGGKERAVPLVRTAASETQASGSYLLAAEDLKVRPGDVITYYARARDVGRGKPSSESRSDLFFLEVRPFNEEFVAAQSQAGGGGGDPQIESLIDAQKEIISATWNIERRAAAGRSAEDLKAVATAQAELKARVERLVAGSRRRGRELMPQQRAQRPPQASTSADSMGAALEAMIKAVEQLASGRTRDAITHEMAALNGLVQAQAEVRRRQVAQQQASGSGGGWGNRQSQDLSALFDKELQRQQRTNYEQRSQIEERPEQQRADNSALDKIRELARRQEELSRQQREAGRLAEEERRRQLERLTREQQELQRQAEQLSREMSGQQSGQQQTGQQQSGQQQSGQQQSGQQQSRQQQSGQQQSGQQQSGQQQSGQQASGQPRGSSAGNPAMREAVEQMRQASSDLKREDGESAARRGERAAQQLRDLEDRLRGNNADARQRAAADLQSEAQQIAQEQRRIAAEAERLERAGDANTADARRRLAADKERLSERVDALQREAERLGTQASGAKGAEGARAREAAGKLEQERVGERMREGAEQMRAGTQGASGHVEQQMARTLESVIETLGGASSAQAEAAARQLDASRETRERLDALEARLREAEAKGGGEAEKLRQAYDQELRRTREELGRQGGASGREQQRGGSGATPEQYEYSRSAPGTEAFKQDRSDWTSLRKEIDRALEARDADASRKLARSLGEDRLSAGGSERVPEKYRKLVARYYETLGKPRK